MGLSSQLAPSAIARPGVIANAAARPASPYDGQAVYQQDTDVLYIWNGTAWIPMSGRVPACKVRLTTDTSGYTNNAVITFTSEVYDTDSMFAPSDSKITINTAGLYVASFYGAVVGANTGTIANVSPSITTPTTTLVAAWSNKSSATDWRWSVSMTEYLTAGTQVRAQVYFDGGPGSVTLGGTNGYQQCNLSVHYLGQN